MHDRTINPKHVLGIDALRFVAALLVLWSHYCFLGLNPADLPNRASRNLLSFPELYDWSNFGWIGVEIFFVISGFVIAFSAEKATPFSFFVSRLTRLGPGVWICGTITLAVTLAIHLMPAAQIFRAYFLSIFLMPVGPWIDPSYWTLRTEIMFYSTVFVLLLLNRFDAIRALAMLIGSVSSAYWIADGGVQLLGLQASTQFMLNLRERTILGVVLVHHGLYFALGVFLWLQCIRRPGRENLIWIATFIVGALFEISAATQSMNKYRGHSYAPFVAWGIWLLSVATIVISVKFNGQLHRLPTSVLRGLRTAGLMTFPLYLIHLLVGSALMARLFTAGLSRWAALAATVTFILTRAWVIASYAEPWLQEA